MKYMEYPTHIFKLPEAKLEDYVSKCDISFTDPSRGVVITTAVYPH